MNNVTDLFAKNVLGGRLRPCCSETQTNTDTGFHRDGFCRTGLDDPGNHSVCAIMTEAFLTHSLEHGNDLVTPNPESGFPGLKPGDKWCLCASRWQEALESGVAPPVELDSCHERALEEVSLADLRALQLQ